jgi:hypothetical protein
MSERARRRSIVTAVMTMTMSMSMTESTSMSSAARCDALMVV